jgi:hypothetical protein
LNTFLYNWKEERNDEVNKRERNTSTSTTTTTASAVIAPKPCISDNVYAAADINNNDPLFDRKIDLVTEGIGAFFDSKLRELPDNNALTIIDYILSM